MANGKDTFYFPHDYNSRNDHKIKKLLSQKGMLGYGIFWSIVEDLYNNANALPLDYDSIAFDLRVDPKLVEQIVNDFGLFDISKNKISSKSVAKRLNKRKERSEKARKSAEKRWNNANAMRTQCEPNAIKERKGKERKGKENKDINIYVEKWNNLAEKYSLSKIIKVTEKRTANIQNRIKEEDFDFDKIIEEIENSDFLLGKKTDWKIDFDFIFSSRNNYVKILEGKYRSAAKKQYQQSQEEFNVIQ